MAKLQCACVIGLLLTLAGCAGSPVRISMMSPGELRAANSYDLCNAYAYGHSVNVREELARRDVIPVSDWPIIQNKKIHLGMSELGLICSWGYPGAFGTINQTVTALGVSKQWVYRQCDTCDVQYVYTTNGKITAWQN